MKKLILICLLLIPGVIFAAGSRDSYVTAGAGYHRISEHQNVLDNKIVTTLNGFGVWMESHEFSGGQNTGFYMDLLVFSPLGGSISINGSKANYSLSRADYRLGEAFTMGMSYRKLLNLDTVLLLGVGPAVQFFGIVDSSVGSTGGVLLGLGSNLSLNVKLNDSMFFNAGIRGEVDLACYAMINNDGDWVSDYFAYSLTPHVGVTLKFDR